MGVEIQKKNVLDDFCVLSKLAGNDLESSDMNVHDSM